MRCIHLAQIDARVQRAIEDTRGICTGVQQQRVEKCLVQAWQSDFGQGGTQRSRLLMDAQGDVADADRAVPQGVHAGHHSQQHLGRTDVGRRLFTADVLLACLQGESQRVVAMHILGHADQSARHVALELIATRHETGVGPTKSERHAKSLGGSNGDVRTPLARRLKQRQRQQIRRARHDRSLRMQGLSQGSIVLHLAQ